MGIEEIAGDQGWTDQTLLMLLLRWISLNGHDDKVSEYLQDIADEENKEL